jgi:hypothetical protein
MFRAIVRNGIGGTTVFDADFTQGITSGGQTTFTESSANAATVTINRATSGRKCVAVTRNVLLFGTDDYLEVADNALLNFGAAQDFTVMAAMRYFGTTPAGGVRLVNKFTDAGTGAGWSLGAIGSAVFAPRIVTADGTTTGVNNGANTTAGALAVVAMVINRTTQRSTPYTNNTAGTQVNTTTIGSLSNALNMRIGQAPDSASNKPFDGEFVAAAVFRRALTTNEIATIVARYT